MNVLPAGRSAFLLELARAPSVETSRELASLRAALVACAPPELRDVVPAFTTLLVEHRPGLSAARRDAWLQRALPAASQAPAPREHEVRVAYGVDADREALEARLGLPWTSIVRHHVEHRATVAFVGFTPGFPYLLGLPEALRLPRRERPRERIPAGAVAIADGRGGLYASASPGGWWVVGRSDARPFAPHEDPPARFAPGDVVRYRAVDEDALVETAADSADEANRDGPVEVLEAWPGSADLQGAPRWGVGHFGMAQAGGLDPVATEVANRLVGNARFACALECIGQPLTLRTEVDLRVAVTGGGTAVAVDGRQVPTWRALTWPAGTRLELLPDPETPGRTAVLAVAGGWRGETYRGSDATDHRAGLGGSRRWLRPSDRLATGPGPSTAPLPHPGRPRYGTRALLRLHPGPQYEPAAFDALVSHSFRLGALDRTGVRLEGRAVPMERSEIESEGSPFGAVQVPPDGHPIVLLADRGRTGGYGKPGVVDPRDLWQLAQLRPGQEAWFLDARPDGHGRDGLDSIP